MTKLQLILNRAKLGPEVPGDFFCLGEQIKCTSSEVLSAHNAVFKH